MNTKVKISKLEKRFGDVEVLRGVSFDVQESAVVSILGRSGSGKSTLLRCVNLLETPTAGHIYIDGDMLGYVPGAETLRPMTAKELARQRKQIGMVFQNFNLFPHLTALENVAIGPLRAQGLKKPEAFQVAEENLERVGLANRSANYPAQLSGGQQQRVAIARALAMKPSLMLFDEPTSALDPELVGEVLEVIRGLAEEGMTMLIVTHEMQFAAEVSDQVIFMDNGQVVENGPPEEVIFNPSSEAAARFFRRVSRAG